MNAFRQYGFLMLLTISINLLQSQCPYAHAVPECPGGTINVFDQLPGSILWAGTEQGLFSFSGKHWLEIMPADTGGFGAVSAIAHDSSGTRWVGTAKGDIWRYHQEQWQLVHKSDSILDFRISSIIAFTADEIIAGTFGAGIYYVSGSQVQPIRHWQLDEQIYALSLDHTNRLWVATDAGLAAIRFHADTFDLRLYTVQDGLPDIICMDVKTSVNGDVFAAGFEDGLGKFSPEKDRFESVTETWTWGNIERIALGQQGRIWVATNEKGIIRVYEKEAFPCLKGISANTLYLDKERNLWTSDKGGNIKRIFTPIESLPVSTVRAQSIALDEEGHLWVGGEEGLFTWKSFAKGWEPAPLPEPAHIISIAIEEGSVWAGSFGTGLWVSNSNKSNWNLIDQQNGLPDNNILSIVSDLDSVWLATLGGLVAIKKSNLKIATFEQIDSLPQNYLYQAMPDRRGGLWVGADGKGLFFLEGGEATRIGKTKGESMYAIYQSAGNAIWAASESGILLRQDDTDFSIVKEADKQPYTGLEGDIQGNVLAIGENGCVWYGPEGQARLYYDREHFQGAIDHNLNASTTDKNGNIWIAAGTQVLCVWPISKQQRTAPIAKLTTANILLEPMGDRNPAALAYHENHLSFSFYSLWYQHPKSVTYRYRLSGYDVDWIASMDELAVYPKLPPGTYTFELQAASHYDFSQSNTIQYTFTIRKPWWKTLWFIIAVIILLIFLIWFLVDLREKRLRKIAKLEQEKISFQLETLRQQINPHFLFNSLNTLLDLVEENHKKEAVSYIERLSDLFRNVLTHRHQTVISLGEEIDITKDFFQLQKPRFGDNLRLKIDVNSNGYRIPPLTIQLLVENAIKHNEASKALPLTIEVFIENEEKLIVRNNLQVRRKPAASTGTGLHNIRSRFEVLTDKQIEVEENESYFTVKIPLLNKSITAI